jgi:hypothetical protein
MFAEMPLDNRTVNKSAALFALVRTRPPLQALSGPFELYRVQHDLMFRRG